MYRSTLFVFAVAVFGCSQSNPGRSNASNGGTNAGGTNSGTNSGSTSNGGNGDGGTGTPDPNQGDPGCGEQDFMLQKGLPPDLLIVLDKSGSMSDDPGNGMGSKWDQITAAINQTVSSLQGQIKWGLEVFPSDNDCGVSTMVEVPIGTNNAAAIAAAITATGGPNGSTPTTSAIQTGTKYLQTISDSNPKYLLVATDGEPNCTSSMPTMGGTCMCTAPFTQMGSNCCFSTLCLPCSLVSAGDDAAASEQAVSDAVTAGVHTFVVGIAADSSDDAVLNQMAVNGGEALPGATKYFQVTSTSDLVTSINTIAGQIISCNFALQMAPDRPDDTTIEVNGTDIPRDKNHMSGWDYGPGNLSIQFYGSFCQQLQMGSVMDVKAIFGCTPVS